MIKAFFLLVPAFALTASTSANKDKTPVVLKPSSAWNMDYAADSCRLARQFGNGDDEVLLVLNRYGPSQGFHMVVSGKPMKMSGYNGEAEVQFGPSEDVQTVDYAQGTFGKMPAMIFTGDLRVGPMTSAELIDRDRSASRKKNKVYTVSEPAPIDDARKKAVKYLELGKPLLHSLRLEIGSMQSPLAALDECTDELIAHWGIDVEKHKNLKANAAPANYPGEWVTTNDYPSDMLRTGQPANVSFRLDVDVDGKPTGCHIQATTRAKEFDDAVCGSILKRARFTPALDADGKPVASYYINQVNFRLP